MDTLSSNRRYPTQYEMHQPYTSTYRPPSGSYRSPLASAGRASLSRFDFVAEDEDGPLGRRVEAVNSVIDTLAAVVGSRLGAKYPSFVEEQVPVRSEEPTKPTKLQQILLDELKSKSRDREELIDMLKDYRNENITVKRAILTQLANIQMMEENKKAEAARELKSMVKDIKRDQERLQIEHDYKQKLAAQNQAAALQMQLQNQLEMQAQMEMEMQMQMMYLQSLSLNTLGAVNEPDYSNTKNLIL